RSSQPAKGSQIEYRNLGQSASFNTSSSSPKARTSSQANKCEARKPEHALRKAIGVIDDFDRAGPSCRHYLMCVAQQTARFDATVRFTVPKKRKRRPWGTTRSNT